LVQWGLAAGNHVLYVSHNILKGALYMGMKQWGKFPAY